MAIVAGAHAAGQESLSKASLDVKKLYNNTWTAKLNVVSGTILRMSLTPIVHANVLQSLATQQSRYVNDLLIRVYRGATLVT